MKILNYYYQAAAAATKDTINNPIAIVGILGLFIVFVLAQILVGFLNLGFAGGVIISFAFLILLTIGYKVCEMIHTSRQKIKFEDFKEVDWGLFSAIINSGFIVWLVAFTLEYVSKGFGAQWIVASFNLIVIFALNPLPEIAITRRLDGMGAIQSAFEFMKQNTLEWILPILLLLSPLIIIRGIESFILRTVGADVLFPPPLLLSGVDLLLPFSKESLLGLIISIIINSALGLWIMLFRLNLFERLDRNRL